VGNRMRAAILLSMVAVAVLGIGVLAANAQTSAPPACGGKVTGLGDPCGDNTGNSVDVVGTPSPTLNQENFQTVTDAVGKTKIGLNFTWTLVTGFLVMFMQAGFALVETGFCRRKNSAHVLMTNFMI